MKENAAKVQIRKNFKTYGSHRNGDFYIYLSPNDQLSIIRELDIEKGEGSFEFQRFIDELNTSLINKEIISHSEKIDILREHKAIVSELIDEKDKTVLIGIKHLSKGTPQDRTLRKLYLLCSEDPKEITDFIEKLKETNCTVAWTTPEREKRIISLSELIQQM